ncbi:alternative splicing factor ASF-1, putative [Plasmodium vivax]|uniref:Alternative splicing factor ASF-1, putative n=6 Tax=Plasmodium vivax TaxID=5855 RepID=A5K4L1_PLAVS|nr:alternative splicing factor ASF-1, putative [Plasmodium vivax]KMZ80443.1 alternative splicing factor ASF-1 [Plasmodium vivax India VII]KMZ93238.1 alternative splicing factor ASF-1 [Plasmodium vivax Mauritania I]KMZ99731.1 alternative splicing factor ASF-1 [Plasmodium vivax North Korean]EDL45589.1 alternative splicing factor ASF-1, putative [Plasmodium vivax]CAG9476797.1 unnamed protein product [Plasmodium vivax]|eukprot:XP_001615316.1 alternative splicing factor ASF-1 [Plasmodium vivax Sal-1]
MKAGKSGHRIYVGNIPGSMSKQEIIKAFEEFGKITEIDIKYNRNTNGTNYAFIEYESYKSAEKTIENKNGQKLKGYMLKVEYSIDKKNKEGGDLIALGGREAVSKGLLTNVRLPKNRSHYRVVVKNFPRKKIKLDGIKTFLMKAGKVIYTQLEDEITIAEYDCREGMLRAVNTLDRTMFNSTRKVYVRVLKDLPYDDSDADDSAQGCR